MLLGLLRLRLQGGVFGLGRLLWRQVQFWRFSLIVCEAHNFHVPSVYKGVIWLLLATVAEVPPTVCLDILLAPLVFAHRPYLPQVSIFLNLNGIRFHPLSIIHDGC